MIRVSGTSHAASRLQLARLTSTLGTGVAGVGLGVMLARWLNDSGLVILLVGALVHAWGMFDGMRLERQADLPRPSWSVGLYWLCWALLAAVFFYVSSTIVP